MAGALTLMIAMDAPVSLVSVTLCAWLVVPSTWLAKDSAVVLSVGELKGARPVSTSLRD